MAGTSDREKHESLVLSKRAQTY